MGLNVFPEIERTFSTKNEWLTMKFSYVFLLTVAMTYRTSFLLARLDNGFGLFLDLGQLKLVNDGTEKETSK